MPVRIVTDSTCDLPAELVEAYGITVVPLTVFFGDEALLDGAEITAAGFYPRLASSPVLPRTSQPPVEAFREAYEALAAAGEEIVSVHISSRLSGTLNSASIARDQVTRDGGGARIELIDSYTVSLGLGWIVLEAATAAQAGAPLAAVVAAARHAMDRVAVYVAVDTLEYLQKGGRIGRARSLLGSVLSIKPILAVEGGEVVPVDRVRTRRKAHQRLAVLATADRRARGLFIAMTGDEEDGHALAGQLHPLLPHTDIRFGHIGPVVGVYVGPGAMGIAILKAD